MLPTSAEAARRFRAGGPRARANALWGNGGNDRVEGASGRDSIFGGSGDDQLRARDLERDTLDGGSGNDRAQADRGGTVADSVLSIESFIA